MAANPQTHAIQTANAILQAANSLMGLYQQMVVIDADWTDNGVATILNALGTVAANADGSTGAADGTPNVAHPIDPTKYPGLARSVSANQIAGMKTILDNIVLYVNGSAVSATASARGILNSATGG